jgi:hypothetical protein
LPAWYTAAYGSARRSSNHRSRPTTSSRNLVDTLYLLPLRPLSTPHTHSRSNTSTSDNGPSHRHRRLLRSRSRRCLQFLVFSSLLAARSPPRMLVSSSFALAPSLALIETAAGQSPTSQHRQSSSPQLSQTQQTQQQPTGTMQRPQQPSSYVAAPTVNTNTRMTLPPTPPMHPDAAGEGQRSPSSASTHSAASAAYFMGASLNNMEPHHQRQVLSSMPPVKRDSIPNHSMSPYNGSIYAQSPYQSSPGNASATSFYSPEQHSYNGAGMYAQRPLPSNYQPSMPLPMPQPSATVNSSNPWQHHHYISTSSQSAFPQSQDRYICSTCNKAFSRPSSLRIHSHSHTGEKPYKCPQAGCGKAFSVRSNMKRHERGCHASTSTTITT